MNETDKTIDSQLTISDKYYSFYIKITGIDENNRNESQYIKIYVQKDFIFYDEFSKFLETERDTIISNMDLFK